MRQGSTARYGHFIAGVCALALSGASQAGDDTLELARTGPGNIGPGDFFTDVGEPSVNNVGAVLFRARRGGGATNAATDSGLFVYRVTSPGMPVSQPLTAVLREDDTVDAGGLPLRANSLLLTTAYLKDIQLPPGVAVTGAFSDIAFELPVRAGLASGNTAILRERPLTLASDDFELVAAEGEDVPNGDGRFGDLGGFNLFGHGQHGDVGFFTSLSDSSAGAANDTAIYRYGTQSGAVEIVREGDGVGGQRAEEHHRAVRVHLG